MSKSDTPRTDAPEIIYLQTGGMDEEHFGHPLFDSEQVTWCRDKQYDSDIKYVRADKAETELAAANLNLQAISQQEGWRGIESAPKPPLGGMLHPVLMGFSPDEENYSPPSREGYWMEGHKQWRLCSDPSWKDCPQPTHWQPLPAPPTQSKGE